MTMKRLRLSVMAALLATTSFAGDSRPNVLLIAIDDLNDWIGCMGGHPAGEDTEH